MSTWPQVVKTINLIKRLGAKPLTIQEVAETVAVKERQAYRILKMIQDELGIFIERDEFGGVFRYFLQGTYLEPLKVNVPSMALTPQERLVLSNLLAPSPLLKETSLWDHYALLMKRIEADHEQYSDAVDAPGRKAPLFSISIPMRKDYRAQADLLALIFEAVQGCFCLELAYKSPRAPEAKHHSVEPIHVMDHRGGLYLFARLPQKGGVLRVFAIDRIQSCEIQNATTFIPPTDFDPKAVMAQVFDLTLNDLLTAVIWFAASETSYIKEREWSSKQSLEVHPDGSCTLTMETSGHDDVARWVMGFGGNAEVLGPELLREKVKAALTAGTARYETRLRTKEKEAII